MRCKERGQGWIASGITPTPIVQNTGRMRIGLQINAIDHQHLLVVLLNKPFIIGKGRELDAADAHRVQRFRPGGDWAFTRLVDLGIAIAGDIPPAFCMNLQQKRALVTAVDNARDSAG